MELVGIAIVVSALAVVGPRAMRQYRRQKGELAPLQPEAYVAAATGLGVGFGLVVWGEESVGRVVTGFGLGLFVLTLAWWGVVVRRSMRQD